MKLAHFHFLSPSGILLPKITYSSSLNLHISPSSLLSIFIWISPFSPCSLGNVTFLDSYSRDDLLWLFFFGFWNVFIGFGSTYDGSTWFNLFNCQRAIGVGKLAIVDYLFKCQNCLSTRRTQFYKKNDLWLLLLETKYTKMISPKKCSTWVNGVMEMTHVNTLYYMWIVFITK